MAIDASGVLGSRQLAGVKVNRRGYAWNLARNQSGNLAADIVLGGQPAPGRAETPPFRLAYLAVTDSELALLRLRSRKVVMLKAAEVITRVPRSQLRTAELGAGGVAELTIGQIGGVGAHARHILAGGRAAEPPDQPLPAALGPFGADDLEDAASPQKRG